MPDYTAIKISDLDPAGGVSDNDLLPIVQNGTTFKITKAALESALTTAPSGLAEFDVEGSNVITVQPAHFMVYIVLIGDPGPVKVGTTEGGGEIMDDEIIDTHIVYSLPYYFLTETQVWFTGTFSAKVWFI